MSAVHDDVVIAAMDLAGRAGAKDVTIGFANEDAVRIEDAGWYITATYKGARITVDEHQSPGAAAIAFAERILTDATCRCTRPVSLSDDVDGCRWRLVGPQWAPGCDEPPLAIDGERGDHAAMAAAMGNRAARRARERRRPR